MLEASYVTFLLPPYHRSFNKRLTKRRKLYFVDTGLLCWLLRIRNAEQLASHAARGAVFENLVIAEALKVGCNAGEPPDLYHWRDQRGNEIDLVVETPRGPHLVEMKSGETVGGDFFKGIATGAPSRNRPYRPRSSTAGPRATSAAGSMSGPGVTGREPAVMAGWPRRAYSSGARPHSAANSQAPLSACRQ